MRTRTIIAAGLQGYSNSVAAQRAAYAPTTTCRPGYGGSFTCGPW